MGTLSVIILTKNEENDIEATIQKSWQCADEVLVVDSGSTDKTVELARKNGARVVFRAWDNDYAAQRNFGLTQTDADWVLFLDADERPNDDLAQAVRNIVKADSPDKNDKKQYSFKRKAIAFGTRLNYGVLYPDWVPRLFPRMHVTWVGKIHERPVSELPLEKLPGHVDHYTYRSWQEWWSKMGQYSTIWAEERYKQGKRTSLFVAFLHGIGNLLSMLVLRGGFLDGWMGICLSFMYCSYTLQKYLKLYELQKRTQE